MCMSSRVDVREEEEGAKENKINFTQFSVEQHKSGDEKSNV